MSKTRPPGTSGHKAPDALRLAKFDFQGDKLLTTGNPDWASDRRLFDTLGLIDLAPEKRTA